MRRFNLFQGTFLGAIFLGFFMLLALPTPAASQSEPKELFSNSDLGEDTLPGHAAPHIERGRIATLDLQALGGPGRSGLESEPAERVIFNLFSNRRYVAKLLRTETLDGGGYAWIGEIPSIKNSEITIVIRDGSVTANIRLPSEQYEIRPSGSNNEIHAIREVNGFAFGEIKHDAVETDSMKDSGSQSAQTELDTPAADSGDTIDVMVVYSSAAKQAVGGQAAMEDLIDLGFVETNLSLANSGANFTIRKAHTQEIGYASSGNAGTDLTRLRSTSDGYMDEVHALRDQHNADLVSLWLKDGGCGIGYLWSSASYAFSIARIDCATGNLTFGHEIGHNMGLRHDWYVDDTIDSQTTYNKGYANPDGQWRTVMAYNSLCAASNIYCTRLTNFSNPNVFYSSAPTGFAENTGTNCVEGNRSNPNCDSHNARILNERAATVANFRSSGSPSTPTPTAVPPTLTPTSEPTATATSVPPTPSPTNEPVATATATSLPPTPTPTGEPSATATSAPPTSTPTSEPTATATSVPPTSTPTSVPTATPEPQPIGVTFYSEADFSGSSYNVSEVKSVKFGELKNSIGDNAISSIEIHEGFAVKVCDAKNGRSGCQTFTSSQTALGSLDNAISYIEVIEAP